MYTENQLCNAALSYLIPEDGLAVKMSCIDLSIDLKITRLGFWPWSKHWWKPTPNDRVRELVKAGALIAAEIDRLQAKSEEE
jgi:hypothetical protein